MIEIEQKWIERFYFDPVMAAHVIMGARLDTFQKARLRFFWFTSETIDSSGVGTGEQLRISEWDFRRLRRGAGNGGRDIRGNNGFFEVCT